MQTHFLCMAHNLMIRRESELAWRAKRLEKEQKRLAKVEATLPMLVQAFQRLTVRSVKFIRWLKGCNSSPGRATNPTSLRYATL